MAKVRVIPSTINPVTLSPLGQLNRRKVAAYARVSTDDEEQATMKPLIMWKSNFKFIKSW